MSSKKRVEKWITAVDNIRKAGTEKPHLNTSDDDTAAIYKKQTGGYRRFTTPAIRVTGPRDGEEVAVQGMEGYYDFQNQAFEPDYSDSESEEKSTGEDDDSPFATLNHVNEVVTSDPDDTQLKTAVESPRTSKKKSKRDTEYTWDKAAESSEDNIQQSTQEIWKRITIFFKIVLCFLIFGTVFVTTVFNKLCIVLMTYNIHISDHDVTVDKWVLKPSTGVTEVKWIWALIITVCAPYVFTIIKCLWRLCFKKTRSIKFVPFIVNMLFETIHSIGLIIFAFVVLPFFDPFIGLLLPLNVASIPAFLKLFYTTTRTEQNRTKIAVTHVLDVVALLMHLGVIVAWTYALLFRTEDRQSDVSIAVAVLLPLSLILISVHWWENYITGTGEMFFKGIKVIKKNLKRRRTKITLLTCAWKVLLTIFIPIGLFSGGSGNDCAEVLLFRQSSAHNCSVFESAMNLTHTVSSNPNDTWAPVYVALVSVACSIVCYKVAKVACKVLLQPAAFALPLVLCTPVGLLLVLELYSSNNVFGVTIDDFGPLSWTQPLMGEDEWKLFLERMTIENWIPLGALGFVSLMVIARHIWLNSQERLATTEKLFIQPLYCGVLLDQSMMLNRRWNEKDFSAEQRDERTDIFSRPDATNIEMTDLNLSDEDFDPNRRTLRTDTTPMIYMCGTMWHENENEMVQILKSIFRCDIDQCARRNAQMYFNVKDPDYYEFEAHIFFDDAFEAREAGIYDYSVNGFVKLLVRVMDLAASSVHNIPLKIPAPFKKPTPYGGRLEWTLPGGNKIIAHLKDKAKIRHRKRWSQVMYMYYFLGYGLLAEKIPTRRKRKIADNTFLLALDGDVDFQPEAVRLLVDRMRKNPGVGAACGRILPIGNGPMVWYQKFEYAISHWLQKATEHMLGSVLCSPGCFSLFRASAVMDDNVMKRYTTPPSEARHYVQYDQGEDRWLCTLLLQQGYRVEYCAASDALTYAPEGFYEFYNQRRRWAPSTMANILDLLSDWKNVTRKNDDISTLYIIYQSVMMISSILTPGTIFLLITGALNAAYPSVEIWVSLIINLIPVAIFVLLCFVAKPNIQLAYAAVLSLVYTLLMMVVMVGLLRSAAEDQLCSVTSIFLLLVAGIFVIAAFAHPREFTCILHGPLYFLSIPSMSLLLILYSLCNLHVVTWGTREAKQAPPASQKTPTKQAKQKGTLDELLKTLGASDGETSDYVFGVGNLFRCLCCPQPIKETQDALWRNVLERLNEIDDKIDTQQYSVPSIIEAPVGPYLPSSDAHVNFSEAVDIIEGGDRSNPLFAESKQQERDELIDPYWVHDKDVGDGRLLFLDKEEIKFWNQIIEKYLFPLEKDSKHEKQVSRELIELRNKVCLFFVLLNALFITVVFVLESQSSLTFTIPCTVTTQNDIDIEPLSVTFTLVFGVVLSIQFIAMLFHRMSTFLHIAAITEIRVPNYIKHPFKKSEDGEPEKLTVEDAVDLAKDLQAFQPEDTQSLISLGSTQHSDDTVRAHSSKDLFKKMERRKRLKRQPATLGRRFQKNFNNLVADMKRKDVELESGSARPGELYETLTRKYGNTRRKSIQVITAISQNPDLKESFYKKSDALHKFRRVATRAQEDILENEDSQDGKSGTDFADVVKQAMERQKALINAQDGISVSSEEQIQMEPIAENEAFIDEETYDETPLANGGSEAQLSTSLHPEYLVEQPTKIQAENRNENSRNITTTHENSQAPFLAVVHSGFSFGPPTDRRSTQSDVPHDELHTDDFSY